MKTSSHSPEARKGSFLVGRTISQYRILERLGAGGMGEVYLAEDLRAGRRVALKVLPEAMAARPLFLERFRREARAAASLEHPNIVAFYAVEEEDGVPVLAMELVEGKTLAELIPPGGMELDALLAIAVQVADALDAAHARGIVHRDIKPRNLMVTDAGQVKVLDFGIAKRLPVEDEPTRLDGQTELTLTGEGQILGTLSYMSPEQLQGQPLDPRSDLFSLGVVLYQMATGHLPFRGSNPVDQMLSILEGRTAMPGVIRAGLPRRLDEIVARCLERDPRQRYQGARVLCEDLEALRRDPLSIPHGAGAPLPVVSAGRAGRARPLLRRAATVVWSVALVGMLAGATGFIMLREPAPAKLLAVPSLAVLPLENLSGEQEYFVDGMTEALIASLGRIGKVRVISRQSVMRYKGSDKPLPAIARELRVGLVLTGSVLRAGDQVRITTELVQADPEEQLWADSYQRNLRDVLALQGEVAQEVARQVQLELTDQEKSRLSSARPVDPVAYDFYLQGRFHWEKRTREELEKAIGYFEKAIARDPGYAAAHAGLADAHAQLGFFKHEPPETAFPKARAEVDRALVLDPDLAEAHASLGYLKLIHDWDGAGSEAELRRALALNPSYASGHHWLALYLSSVGRLDEAGEHLRTARQLNPFSATLNTLIGTHLLATGDVNGSIEQCRKAIDLDAKYTFAYDNLWLALDAAGRFDEAFAAYEKVLSLRGYTDLARSARRIYGKSGYRAALARTGDGLAAAGPSQLSTMTQSYVLAGENEKALTGLERALERREPSMLWLRYAAHFRRLQGEPRFQKLLAQVDRLRSRAG